MDSGEEERRVFPLNVVLPHDLADGNVAKAMAKYDLKTLGIQVQARQH